MEIDEACVDALADVHRRPTMASSWPKTMLASPCVPLLKVVRASSASLRSSWSEKNALAPGCV